jgi:threonine aldolase
VQTNIINLELPMPASVFCDALQKKGIKVKNIGFNHVRLVTHKDFSTSEIEQVISRVEICLENNPSHIGV